MGVTVFSAGRTTELDGNSTDSSHLRLTVLVIVNGLCRHYRIQLQIVVNSFMIFICICNDAVNQQFTQALSLSHQ